MKKQKSSYFKKLSSSERGIFLGSFYSFFVNGGLALILGAILPYMKVSYNLDYVIVGILLSAHSVGNLFSSFIAGIIPIYLGRKKSILFLTSMGTIAFILMTITDKPYLLILAFFLTGINRGAVSNFNNSVINEIATGQGSALNMLHSMFAIGAFVSPFIAMILVSINKDGWKYAALLWAFLCFTEILAYGFMDIPDNKAITLEKKTGKADLSFLKSKFFITACGILFFYLAAEEAINGWLVTYFIESNILSNKLAQSMSSILWIFILFGRLLTAYLSFNFKNSRLMLVNTLGYVFFFTILLLSRSLVPVLIGIIGVGFFKSSLYPTTIASMGHLIKEFPMALSFLLAIAGLGSIMMPSIVGLVADNIGIIGGMATVIIAVIITLLFIIYNAYIYRDIK